MSSSAPRAGARILRPASRLAVLVAVLTAAHATGACRRSPPPAATVTLWLGGDVHLGDGEEADRRLAALAPLTAGAIGVVNLEGAVADRAARDGELVNLPARLPGLRRAGVVAAGVANNHAADLGPDAPAATVGALIAARLIPIGGPAGAALLDQRGVRVVITAHDLPPGPAGAGAPPALDTAALAADLAAARAAGDVLVATFHVTAPPSYLPAREAVTAVALARAAGAAVIVVHGSHALARVERSADAVTAWGLGNLLFACACTDEEDALLLRVTLDRHGLVDAEVVPIAAGLRGAPARPAAEPALVYDLLASLRSTPLAPAGPRARLLAPAP